MRRLDSGRLLREWNDFDGAHGPWPERAEVSVAIPSLWNRRFHWRVVIGLESDAFYLGEYRNGGPFISANSLPDEPHLGKCFGEGRHIRLALRYLTAHLFRRLAFLGLGCQCQTRRQTNWWWREAEQAKAVKHKEAGERRIPFDGRLQINHVVSSCTS